MELAAAGISVQPFRTHSQPLLVVSYLAHAAAIEFLHSTARHPQGLGLFQGPALSGKSTIIHDFLASYRKECDGVVVDGRGLDASRLLARILEELEFDVELGSTNEALNVLRVYAMQKAAAGRAPLIVIENADALTPSAMQTICELSAMQVGRYSALRLILASDHSLAKLVQASAMQCIESRLTGSFHLAPMLDEEVAIYLYSKLRAGGCDKPESVLPESVCETVFKASGGWPGIVDRLMLLALASAKCCPLTPQLIEKPFIPAMTGDAGLESLAVAGGDGARLYLTYNGRTLQEIPLNAERIMIGRSEHNDVPIPSRFVSHHRTSRPEIRRPGRAQPPAARGCELQ